MSGHIGYESELPFDEDGWPPDCPHRTWLELFQARQDSLTFDENILAHEQGRTTDLLGMWGGWLAAAKRGLSLVSIDLEVEHARARQEARSTRPKATTDDLEMYVWLDPEYVAVKQLVVERTYLVDVLKSVVEALRVRSDMIQEVGRDLRQTQK